MQRYNLILVILLLMNIIKSKMIQLIEPESKKQSKSHDPDCLQIYKSNTTNKIIEALYIYYE